MEKSKNGVVLFSFGTITDTDRMSENIKLSFLNAFSKFPEYDFIWKYKSKTKNLTMFEKYPNVHPFEWVNQAAILGKLIFSELKGD